MTSTALESPHSPWRFAQRLSAVRRRSVQLIEDLEPEDLNLQGMDDASPPKWHLGHTTWFFETFLLQPLLPGWQPQDERWGYLFNSYYDAIGARIPRGRRGLLSRPTISAVLAWRARVDAGLEALLSDLEARPEPERRSLLELLELGIQHEQQHQELLLMDLLDGFSRNPLEPGCSAGQDSEASFSAIAAEGAGADEPAGGWYRHPGGLMTIGHTAADGFHFDNEAPAHRQWLPPFAIRTSLVRNAEMSDFIADGGYRRPELWLSEGWALVRQKGWQAPRYWRDGHEFTLAGRRPRQPQAPVRHISWFEADAIARWAGARLPSEAEWEVAAADGALNDGFSQVWQWTASPYRPYPGFRPAAGAVGEYNGKFMSSQFVLRGSCHFTPPGHGRLTYRNFFPPASRWMVAGLRLARDVD
ncbi:MAG: ergothioneine biosynthesis protein EgtB [Synechococcaceae cyanobacterium]|nr:ergothioneine biosynthesis protein EgtB [Synechococcaceae cyanobacterium]